MVIKGNDFTTEVLGSVRVYSEPQLLLTLDSQDVYTIGKGKVTLAVANPGTSSIKGTQVEIMSSDDYEVISGSNQYVGDLNPDDFQTVQSEVYISNSESATLKVKVTYLDSYNIESEIMMDVPLKIYDNDELKSFGLMGNDSGSSGFGTIIFVLIVLAVAFFYGRKKFNFGKKKK